MFARGFDHATIYFNWVRTVDFLGNAVGNCLMRRCLKDMSTGEHADVMNKYYFHFHLQAIKTAREIIQRTNSAVELTVIKNVFVKSICVCLINLIHVPIWFTNFWMYHSSQQHMVMKCWLNKLVKCQFVVYDVSPALLQHKAVASWCPANTKHSYNICTTSFQRLQRWSSFVQMIYKCFVFWLMCKWCTWWVEKQTELDKWRHDDHLYSG